MEQNMRFGLILGQLAVLKISDWAVKYVLFEGHFPMFLENFNIMKKLATNVAQNSFQYCQPTQNQPKSHILFHKNGSLRNFCII